MFLPMLVADSEAVPDLDALSEGVTNGKHIDQTQFRTEESNLRLFKRLGGVFKDLDRLGYI